ncbi:MAG: hypothetical protein B6D36_12595 [Planctomycetes bacterium UTPLA1]|jgi:hypothetical protein|nr:MAG: hypothetical protein B6D36_12595 [Planctomycetes bacterium UTPLA1]
MIGCAVPPGARRPIQDSATNPGEACSIVAATFGLEPNHLSLVVARKPFGSIRLVAEVHPERSLNRWLHSNCGEMTGC